MTDFRVHRDAAVKLPRNRRRPRPAAPAAVEALTPAAYRAALAVADGDERRLRVLDARTVVVVNSPTTPWPPRRPRRSPIETP